jgi:PhnB protein
MTTIHPWINFNGNAFEAFAFYKSVFGGEFTKVVRLKDLESPEFPVGDADKENIMLIGLPIGKNSVLMGNDVPSFMGKVNEKENRSKIAVAAESRAEADALFAGLSAGGEVEFPMGASPWGTYFGMLRDKYGIEWMVEFETDK